MAPDHMNAYGRKIPRSSDDVKSTTTERGRGPKKGRIDLENKKEGAAHCEEGRENDLAPWWKPSNISKRCWTMHPQMSRKRELRRRLMN